MSLTLLGSVLAAEQGVNTFRIKESDVKVPEGLALGQYRRIVHPFKNWTLICDENLRDRTRVCNITQSIVDQSGQIVFSWSVAATEEGRPFMIVRTLPSLGQRGRVALKVSDGGAPIEVAMDGCNPSFCVGKFPLGARLRPQIEAEGSVRISYSTLSGQRIEVSAPLSGVQEALSAID